jgi:GTP-binding protein
LGTRFLRHIERTRLLAHLVDVSESSGRDPVHDFEVVMRELAEFSEELVRKPMIVVATKMDVAQDPARVEALRRAAAARGLPLYCISSVTGQGLEEFKRAVADRLDALRASATPTSARDQ